MKDHSKFRSSIRISMHEYFLEIALASYESYQNLNKDLKKLRAEGFFVYGEEPNMHFAYNKHDEVFQSEQQITLDIIKSIVFLNMYCEAYIWDLAASVLGDSYSKKYLDKLDMLSKWIVIPKLLFGKEIDQGHHSIGKLKELIKLRNDFVHSKSRDGRNAMRSPENFTKELTPLDEQIDLEGIFLGISDLFSELNKTNPTNSHKLNFKRAI